VWEITMHRRFLLGLTSVVLLVLLGVLATSLLRAGSAVASAAPAKCQALPDEDELKGFLADAPAAGGVAGGLFNGTKMWAAVVNRDGEICAYTTSTADPSQVWPGSQAIAKSKAYTANAFSLDDFALSTARLYTFTQPGHSLWSLGQSNLFNTQFLLPPNQANVLKNQINGGLIFFGGGVPLYKDGVLIGGLGVSGDTSCADHEIAKRVRDLAGMNPPFGAGKFQDDIVYETSVFAHPVCPNTYKNGDFVGNEAPATYPFNP
jgi:uncharacterized protein GlcG (DUF336 family)